MDQYTTNLILLFVSMAVFIGTFIKFVDNNYAITAIFSIFFFIQCYFGKINVLISLLLGFAVTIWEGIAFYFTKNTATGTFWKFKHPDFMLTQQPMWDPIFYAIFANMMLLVYNIFNKNSHFDLSLQNLIIILGTVIPFTWLMIKYNYNHNLIFIIASLTFLFFYYFIQLDISCIIISLILFPIMEHIYIKYSNVYVPAKTPGEIFIGEEPLHWFVFYALYVLAFPFLYYYLKKHYF
jgi:hypothetical protein